MSGHETRMSIPPELRKQMTPGVLVFVESLLAEIADLRAQVGKNPFNSSLPPSGEHPHAKTPPPIRKTSNKKRGGQPGHPKAQRMLVPPEQVTETIPLKPSHCRRCRRELSGDDLEPLRHQVFELPKIEPIITEYQRHRLTCSHCGTRTTAPLPEGVPAGQSGPRLVAVAAILMALFRQSKRRTALALQTLFGIPCSVGLTVKLQNIASQALHPCYEQLRQALPRSDAVGMDETPTKEASRKAWLWTAVTDRFTVFAVRLTRAAAVVNELLGSPFAGVVTSDRYSGYDHLTFQQLCWEHLKRDFQAMIDAGGKGTWIGERLRECTRELFHHWHQYRDGTITRRTMVRRIQQLQWPVYEALEEGTFCGHDKTAGMCQHILNRYDKLWAFLQHEGVEPTNNASERALRHGVIWRKLSFGTQSAAGSRFVERLLSVIETCRQQERNVIDFVTSSCQAFFNGQPAPTLLEVE